MKDSIQDHSLTFLGDDPTRIDIWVCSQIPKLSRSQVKKLLADSRIRVNELSVKASYKLEKGDKVSVILSSTREGSRLQPISMALNVIHEDDEIVVIDKPAGLVMHPGAGEHGATLVEGLLYHLGERDASNYESLRPGIVHRLDKDTTGVVVCAKNSVSHAHLAQQFAKKTNKRLYTALLDGLAAPNQIVESHLVRDPAHRQRFLSLPLERSNDPLYDQKTLASARWAKSEFTRLVTFGGRLSLVDVRLHTGRTHQIRAHAKMLGSPVLGDPLYGAFRDLPRHFPHSIQTRIKRLKRQMLHARLLGIEHPVTGQYLEFESPLPKDFRDILDVLNGFEDCDEA